MLLLARLCRAALMGILSVGHFSTHPMSSSAFTGHQLQIGECQMHIYTDRHRDWHLRMMVDMDSWLLDQDICSVGNNVMGYNLEHWDFIRTIGMWSVNNKTLFLYIYMEEWKFT